MNDDSIVGSALSQLGGVAKDAVKQISKLPSEAAGDLEKQIAGEVKDKDANPHDKQAVNQGDSNRETEEVVESFYGKSPQRLASPTVGRQAEDQKLTEDEFREQKKLLELRQRLHKQTYYDPTFNLPKKQEERVQEKIEKEEKEKKQMEALELQKQEKKKEELSPAVKQGTHEKYPGIAG